VGHQEEPEVEGEEGGEGEDSSFLSIVDGNYSVFNASSTKRVDPGTPSLQLNFFLVSCSTLIIGYGDIRY